MSSIDYDKPPYGYKLRRNGSCETNESPCGSTYDNTHVCCPHGTECPPDTSVCCKSKSDCTAFISPNPHCADEFGILYLAGDYFCCSNDTYAYTYISGGKEGSVGCADNVGTVTGSVSSISATMQSTSIGTSTSTGTTDPTTSASSTSGSDSSGSSSSSNTGAIAGGVVGGVAGFAIILALIWFFIRRGRSQQKQEQGSHAPLQHYPSPPMSSNQGTSEMAESQFGGELDGRGNQIAELPAHRNAGY
ncbi:hypothetical protein N7456_010733 [Penicillium angulare]|uniref:Epidermal growth factor receptor-like transmembrane-juxtamembrane segment domain-containing protein n=1 Tax=Penicillium angulare TaxID=116970 RepID=A0A9W9F771_9EURO|nr:hypothetical protein N7456_010733 [Penicillium angulare]